MRAVVGIDLNDARTGRTRARNSPGSSAADNVDGFITDGGRRRDGFRFIGRNGGRCERGVLLDRRPAMLAHDSAVLSLNGARFQRLSDRRNHGGRFRGRRKGGRGRRLDDGRRRRFDSGYRWLVGSSLRRLADHEAAHGHPDENGAGAQAEHGGEQGALAHPHSPAPGTGAVAFYIERAGAERNTIA
jgi:hypothetical protein